MAQATGLDVQRFIDEQPLSRFQVLVAVACGAIAFMDGYDVQTVGFVAPALSADLQIPRAALGPLFSSGLFGMVIGAVTFGPLADRFGRKPILLACTLIFGGMSLITSTANSLSALVIFRLLTGFGLGGALPNTVALTSEFTPTKHRATAITTMLCGFSIGAAAGGIVAAGLISSFGWRSVFVVGGVVPLLIAVLSAFLLPESIRFLLLKGDSKNRVAGYLSQIAPGAIQGDRLTYEVDEQKAGTFVVKELFMAGRAKVTLLLWICFFMNLLVIFFLNSWLPTVMTDAGIKLENAIMIAALFQIAGGIGAVILGRIFDKTRLSSFKVLALVYLGAAATTVLIGQSGTSMVALVFAVSAAGFCVTGGQSASNAVAAGFYPTAIRSTGVGWCLGIGRVGSIVGPILGGALLLAVGGQTNRVFWFIAVPALIATAGAFWAGGV